LKENKMHEKYLKKSFFSCRKESPLPEDGDVKNLFNPKNERASALNQKEKNLPLFASWMNFVV
jgi:hypothetical protein